MIKNYLKSTIMCMLLFVLSFSFPGFSSASQEGTTLEMKAEALKSANFLTVLRFDDDCTSLYMDAKVNPFMDQLGDVPKGTNYDVVYHIYEMPAANSSLSQGKLVSSGKIANATDNKRFSIKVPNAEKSKKYTAKLELRAEGTKLGKTLVTNLQFGNCGKDKPGNKPGNPGNPGDNPGTPGDNPGQPGDNPGQPGDNPGKPGNPGNNPGNQHPGNGGKMPKTATAYPVHMIAGIALLLAGLGLSRLAKRA
ncbi:hypothetical protein ACFQ4J_16245 [Laceyella tengchongensis]|jgi:hypothetical protein